MKPAMLVLLLASTDALRVARHAQPRDAPRLIARTLLRSEPEEATPEVDTTAVEARSRALAASKLSVAAVVASGVLRALSYINLRGNRLGAAGVHAVVRLEPGGRPYKERPIR